MTVGQIYRAIGGRLLQGDDSVNLSRVCTDTRQIQKGDLFFALLGERFDAHNFIDRAVSGGAGALVVSRKVAAPEGVPVIQVRDTLVGLQELAAYNRRQFSVPVVGVTGSSGKTTTKDMVAAVLETRFKVLKTRGNFNNEIGLPLTLLDFSEQYDAAVVEMAMRGLGEIDSLCRLARPTCAIINNIGVAHLERLGSEENIARAKGEILDHISLQGFALLPGDSELAREQARRCYGKVLYFGFDPSFDIYAEDIRSGADGNRFTVVMGNSRCNIFLPLPGRHNVMNALAAAGTGLLLGLTPEEIEKGLAQVVLSGMRTEIINKTGLTIINDSYNANPDSAVAALQTLEELAGARRKVAVFGDMLELGAGAVAGHVRVGAAAVKHGVELLITVGELAKQIAEGALQARGKNAMKVFPCADKPEALNVLHRELCAGDMVLVKGSRGMRMEEIVKDLLKD